MALIDEVKAICGRLAGKEWGDVFARHGLNLAAGDLEKELERKLPRIDRTVPGFEDFTLEGIRAIEPGSPARSLLYHALASPEVTRDACGQELTFFPTLAELDTIENYLWARRFISLTRLIKETAGAPVAVVVFASEYRPAPATVHRKHADKCFSRTGVARVGNAGHYYQPSTRGFLPFRLDDPNDTIRVLPARYAAYLAMRSKGRKSRFGPMRGRPRDEELQFWVPIHKLFDGPECLSGLREPLRVLLRAHHVNEKIRRIHLFLRKRGYETEWTDEDLEQPPFFCTDDIAHWSAAGDLGPGVLMPVAHQALVGRARYKNAWLTFQVPKALQAGAMQPSRRGSPGDLQTYSSSLQFRASDYGPRHAPEFVHARQRVVEGHLQNLNDENDVAAVVEAGGYKALHHQDFTGDGWVDCVCPTLDEAVERPVPAYSLVAAPSFFPYWGPRDLLEWTAQAPEVQGKKIWPTRPSPLSDLRKPANLELAPGRPSAGNPPVFEADDRTVTAIVSLPLGNRADTAAPSGEPVRRASFLPDHASAEFSPGWEVSFDHTHGTDHLVNYGLGSPFPEDVKLCAALSAFWPPTCPDTTRVFQPLAIPEEDKWHTVVPFTDDEIANRRKSWDGVAGPCFDPGKGIIEFASFAHVDYVERALKNHLSLGVTARLDFAEYRARVELMERAYVAVYRALKKKQPLAAVKDKWNVLSFRRVQPGDAALREAEQQADKPLYPPVFSFDLYTTRKDALHQSKPRTVRFVVKMLLHLFMDSEQALVSNGKTWKVVRA